MKKITIAIDGYSSSGKSSFAKKIAARFGYIFIDTGAMYRAATLFAMHNGFIDPDGTIHAVELAEALDGMKIGFVIDPATGASEVCLNGRNVEKEIRTLSVSDNVSGVSQIPEVREYLVALQQELGREKGIVMDGRDIGTVVFPDAELKIFMTADPEIRAMRRYKELTEKGQKVSLDEIIENIRKRDHADINRAVSPLKKAPDALILDNSRMSQQEQMAWVEEKINKLIEER